MRTTSEIDDDVYAKARALAAHERVSIGKAVSMLARRNRSSDAVTTTGFPVFAGVPEHVITDELVAAHRDDD